MTLARVQTAANPKNERPESRIARQKLLNKLRRINGEISSLTDRYGEDASPEKMQFVREFQQKSSEEKDQIIQELIQRNQRLEEEPEKEEKGQLSFDFVNDSK